MITVHLDHYSRKVKVKILKSDSIFKTGIRNALFEIGRENVRHTRRLIRDPNKNGRIYRIKGRIHQASAPGEAPANLSGKLAKTMGYNVRGSKEMEFGDKEEYGKYLELGTKNQDGSIRMKRRPHLEKTVDDRGNENAAILLKAVDRGLKS